MIKIRTMQFVCSTQDELYEALYMEGSEHTNGDLPDLLTKWLDFRAGESDPEGWEKDDQYYTIEHFDHASNQGFGTPQCRMNKSTWSYLTLSEREINVVADEPGKGQFTVTINCTENPSAIFVRPIMEYLAEICRMANGIEMDGERPEISTDILKAITEEKNENRDWWHLTIQDPDGKKDTCARHYSDIPKKITEAVGTSEEEVQKKLDDDNNRQPNSLARRFTINGYEIIVSVYIW